jgi:dUTP pyrophosphatase
VSRRAVEILVTRLDDGVPLPTYAHPGDAGADLVTTVDFTLGPGERAMVGTGIAVALPDGYAAFIHPRSGLAHRLGVSIVNTPGTVDAGYRGEITVVLVNHDLRDTVVFRRGDRIAQLVVQRVEQARFEEVPQLPSSARGTGGYGSTGLATSDGDGRP